MDYKSFESYCFENGVPRRSNALHSFFNQVENILSEEREKNEVLSDGDLFFSVFSKSETFESSVKNMTYEMTKVRRKYMLLLIDFLGREKILTQDQHKVLSSLFKDLKPTLKNKSLSAENKQFRNLDEVIDYIENNPAGWQSEMQKRNSLLVSIIAIFMWQGLSIKKICTLKKSDITLPLCSFYYISSYKIGFGCSRRVSKILKQACAFDPENEFLTLGLKENALYSLIMSFNKTCIEKGYTKVFEQKALSNCGLFCLLKECNVDKNYKTLVCLIQKITGSTPENAMRLRSEYIKWLKLFYPEEFKK